VYFVSSIDLNLQYTHLFAKLSHQEVARWPFQSSNRATTCTCPTTQR